MVVDLGGVHSAQDATIELDKLNLEKGKNYPIDIFFAERHTFSSKFRVYTSLDLYCPWKDHCGIFYIFYFLFLLIFIFILFLLFYFI